MLETLASLDDVSVNWFVAQFVFCVAAYYVGRALAHNLAAVADIAVLLVVALSIAWALRSHALDAIVAAAPLWALVYFEGTLIVPPFMFMAGVLAGRSADRRAKRLGALAATFGLAYFTFNAAWMITPHVDAALSIRGAATGPVVQSRADTCVPAAVATALRTCAAPMRASEAQMARTVDARAGRGATLLRTLHGLQIHLAGEYVEPRLITASAHTLAAIASDDRPVLVTLRSSRTMTHMVVLYGRTNAGAVRIFNPAAPADTASGLQFMLMRDFERLSTGSGIVLLPRGALPG